MTDEINAHNARMVDKQFDQIGDLLEEVENLEEERDFWLGEIKWFLETHTFQEDDPCECIHCKRFRAALEKRSDTEA